MDLFPLPRLGIVVPPENPTAEPEFHQFLGGRVNVHTARFPRTPGLALRRMLETYNDVLPDTLGSFGALRLDAAVVACSASHYLLGPDGDREFCARLTARFRLPVASSTQAVLAIAAGLRLRRVTLVSPYEPWLTDTSRAFWEQAGLTVDDVVRVPLPDGRHDPYRVTALDLLDRLDTALPDDDRPLLFTGTGMGTLAVLGELERRRPGRIALTSNQASARWALHTVGRDARASGAAA
ncbi:arylmalonate decarboxylase [Streptomyces sp. NPDC049813]|uniref:aspartate racemase/maleate isomerase family protein n=1 Tax=Streptomyces sp. NPDC049813 TaxID=3365597 RepID=UPI0037B5DEE2